MIDWLVKEKNITAADALRELGGGRNDSEPRGKIVATYDYTDESGNLIYQACRFQPKDFRQRRPDGEGGWIWNLQGVRRVLYRLPEVLKASTVCVAEGEKDCDNLEKLGFVATTNPLGAGKWRDEYNEFLRGKDVVVFGDVGDADRAGEKHTEQVIASLSSKGITARHAQQPDGFHDVSNYIASLPSEAAKRVAAIQKLIDESPLIDQATTAQPEPKNKNDDATIAQLAALPPIDYDRKRKEEAKKLKCRASTLDDLVHDKRLQMHPTSDGDNLQGTAVKLADVEPWPEPVNGAHILDAIAKRFDYYVVMPGGAADMEALWCAHTHMYKLFQKSPRLYISAPTEECGKRTLLNCTSLFCARAKRTDNMTTAVMFRLVAGHSPTILADECDKWLFTNEELVGLVQSGHEKGGTVMRCEGDQNDLREFVCYAPVALAAIGTLPSQLHSRSNCIRLSRARKEEIKTRSPFELEHVEYETELNRKLARWIANHQDKIAACDPQLPSRLFNRIADNWRPLFKIAEIASGDWPKRCANALIKLTTSEDERENLRVMLLADIQQIFTGKWSPPPEGVSSLPLERVFSKDLVEFLAQMKDRPWPEICRGKPINENWLARNLSVFHIKSKTTRIGKEQAKGYQRADFDEVFDRYIPENVPETQEGGKTAVPASRTEVKPEIPSVPEQTVGTDGKRPIYETLGRWDGSKGRVPGKGDKVI